MKKIISLFLFLFLFFPMAVFAMEDTAKDDAKLDAELLDAVQEIEMRENKIIVNVQKQPMNEQSKQKIVLRKNWLVVNIQINGKVKVKPMQMEYEVE